MFFNQSSLYCYDKFEVIQKNWTFELQNCVPLKYNLGILGIVEFLDKNWIWKEFSKIL